MKMFNTLTFILFTVHFIIDHLTILFMENMAINYINYEKSLKKYKCKFHQNKIQM